MPVSHKAALGYTIAGSVLAVGGWLVGMTLVSQPPIFTAAEGVSVFALVYVLAQGVERLVEIVLAVVESVAKSIGKEVAPTTKVLAIKANSKDEAESAEADTRALAFGLALGSAFVACSYFEVGLLKLIGVTELEGWVDRFVSGLIVAGGSKPLHDLITKVQKSKEKDERAAGS